MSTQKKLGICVSWGRTGKRLMVPPRKGPTQLFTLIWNNTEGFVVYLGRKVEKGTWVLFTMTTQTTFLHTVRRKLVVNLRVTNVRRQTAVDAENIQVMAHVKFFQRYNDYYYIGMDQLLGWVLLSDDSFVRWIILQEKLAAQMAVIYRENCVQRGFHWVAIAVNERRQEGTDCYRKLDFLPRFMDDVASLHYIARERHFATRQQLQNPLPSMFVAQFGEDPTTKKMLAKEYVLGTLYGFEKDYERDVNAAQISLRCLVVFKGDKAALVYNKKYYIGVIRLCDFGCQEEFDSICQLGKWVAGKFTRPYLVRQFRLEYNLMLSEVHNLRQIQPPQNISIQFRHFQDIEIKKSYSRVVLEPEKLDAHEIVMVKVPVHFTPGKVTKVKRRMLKGRSGMVMTTTWGNVFVDKDDYAIYNFEGKHLSLWVSFLPQRITTLDHENCWWYFLGELPVTNHHSTDEE